MKTCNNCGEEKPYSEFIKDRRRKDGCGTCCVLCRNKSDAEWRKAHPEETRYKGRLNHRKWTAKNVPKTLLNAARFRARQKQVPFELSVEDIEVPDMCPILGIPIIRNLKRLSDNSPSLDRIRPALGYVKNNIAVISNRANRIKNNGTAVEHEAIAKFMRQHEDCQ